MRYVLFTAQFLALLLAGAPVYAGNNAGGSARLSWSVDNQQSELSHIGAAGSPIYILLEDAPDLQQLALTVYWYPRDTTAACYDLVAGDPQPSCGRSFPGAVRGFDGDSSFSWTIDFSGSIDRSCLSSLVVGSGCPDTIPATFYLIAARAIDSNGRIDDLLRGSPITIAGGSSAMMPLTLSHVRDRYLPPGQATSLTVHGTNLRYSIRAELSSALGTIRASQVTLSSPELAFLTFNVPDTTGVHWTLTVTDTLRSTTASLGATIISEDTTAMTGSGLNGTGGPIEKITSSGIYQKADGSREWAYVAPPPPQVTRDPAREQNALATSSNRHSLRDQLNVTDCGVQWEIYREDFEGFGLDSEWRVTFGSQHYSPMYWDQTTDCLGGYNSSGSAWCAGRFGSPTACTYDRDMDTGLTWWDNLSLQPYYSYKLTFRANTLTQAPPDYFDGLRWGYYVNNTYRNVGDIVGGSNTWQSRQVTVTNHYGDSSTFRPHFGFDSDESVQAGHGAFIDNVVITGIPQPSNLAVIQPQGWESSIVASWRKGTHRYDTLYINQNAYVDCAIKNTGSSPIVCPFRVRVKVGSLTIKDTVFIQGLAAGAEWRGIDIPVLLTATGSHQIRIEADYNSDIEETDEFDNFPLPRTLPWIEPPDLVVQSIEAVPNPADIGGICNIQVSVKNQGGSATPLGSFELRLYKEALPARPSESFLAEVVDTAVLVASIGAGQTRLISIPRRSNTVGSWNYRAEVDVPDWVPEGTNSGSNMSALLLVTFVTPRAHVSGSASWYDSTVTGMRRWAPVRNAKVFLFEWDSLSTPDTLVVTTTDADGEFGPIAIENVDPDEAGPIDVYARVYLETPQFRVTEGQFMWFLDSPLSRNVPSSVVTQLSAAQPGSADPLAKAACHVFGASDSAFRALSAVNVTVPLLTLIVRANQGLSEYFHADNAIIVGTKDSSLALLPDTYDDDVIWHEIGHHIQHAKNFLNESAHGAPVDAAVDATTAFVEGWANYFACWVGDTIYTDTGGTRTLRWNVESGKVTYSWRPDIDIVGAGGEHFSLACAGVVYDLEDMHHNYQRPMCGDQFSHLGRGWQLVNAGVPWSPTLCHFYTGYMNATGPWPPGQAALAESVFCTHGAFDVQPPGPPDVILTACAPVVSDAPLLAPQGGLLITPNPTRAAVSFRMAGARKIKVTVYDVLGRKVWDAAAMAAGGAAQVTWNGWTAAPGIYMARVSSDGVTMTRRFVVLR